MTLCISSELHNRLLAMASASPKAEICGLLIGGPRGDKSIRKITPVANVAADPSDTFEIDPAILFAAIRDERAGRETIIGYYHSHPSGPPTPSARDGALAAPDGKIWVIIGENRITAWRMTETGQFRNLEIAMTE
jgi:desampylase